LFVYPLWAAPLDCHAVTALLEHPMMQQCVPGELPAASQALDAAIGAYRWHRRIAGDARKRNPIIAFLYKGA